MHNNNNKLRDNTFEFFFNKQSKGKGYVDKPISRLPIQQSTILSMRSSNMSHSRRGRELKSTASLNSE